MRDRLLVRHFLTRFLEHDLVSPNADRHETLSVVGGTVIAVSLFISVLTALQYQFDNFMPPGIASVRAVDDRFMFVSASMLVMALLAVALWDALALDARDAAVLGVLPVPRSAIMRTKFIAVALVAAGTDLAWNLAPMLLRLASLPLRLPVGVTGALRLMMAQAVVTLAAGAFGFLSVLALRESLAAVLGQGRFRSISSAVQAALLVALTSALLLLPASSRSVERIWLVRHAATARSLPPIWFVGLHETMAGTVIDRLPRTRPAIYLAGMERDATSLYRSLWPLYHELSRVAIVALAFVTILAVAASAWNSRRLPTPAVRRGRRASSLTFVWKWTVDRLLVRSPLQRAGFRFTLQTLLRRVAHRAVLASGLAVGLALMVVIVQTQLIGDHKDVASVPLSLLAAQPLVLACLLTGFRRAVQLPAELRASGTFSLAWSGDRRPYISGVKRAGLVTIAAPTLVVLSVWHSAVLGVRIAVLHVGTGVAFSILLIELLFLGYPRLPLVSAYVPTADLKSRGPGYVAAVLLASYLLALIERSALATATSLYMVALSIALLAISAAASIADQSREPSASMLDLDEEVPLPTQRLNLAG
jgi:hypothetical protein